MEVGPQHPLHNVILFHPCDHILLQKQEGTGCNWLSAVAGAKLFKLLTTPVPQHKQSADTTEAYAAVQIARPSAVQAPEVLICCMWAMCTLATTPAGASAPLRDTGLYQPA